jgi:hypothetical protein
METLITHNWMALTIDYKVKRAMSSLTSSKDEIISLKD